MQRKDAENFKSNLNCNLFSCKTVYDARTDVSRLKCSNRFKVCLVVSGAGIHRVLDQEIPCAKGDICIIPPNVPNEYFLSLQNDDLTVRQLEFDITDWFSGDVLLKDNPKYCYGVLNNNHIIAYATLNSHMQDRIYSLYDYIELEIKEQNQGWYNLISGYLTNLFITIARYINSAIKSVFPISVKEWEIVSATINIIKERYGDCNITLESIASGFFISKSTLSRTFKKATGMIFSDYLRSVRIKSVCKLLIQSELSVKEIAEKCGFCDMNTFHKVFNSILGMTPKEYRQSILPAEIKARKERAESTKLKAILGNISENLQCGKAKAVIELVKKAIDEGLTPEQILNDGLLAGMHIIGEKFKNSEIYIPEVLVAARAMNQGAGILKSQFSAINTKKKGKVCIGTVQGDIHDIGKNLVKMLMEAKGLEVIDLGTDVPPEVFVNEAIKHNCRVICCSALLTTTMEAMAKVVSIAKQAGVYGKIKIIIGGGPISNDFCKQIGADFYAADAATAADAAVSFCESQKNG